MEQNDGDQLVMALRRASRDLARRSTITDLDHTLGQIVASAVVTVPGIDQGSISLTRHERVETRQPTTEAIAKLDQLQSELNEGPCLTAIDDPPETVIVANDLAGEPATARWPRFAPRAVEAGYRALISTPLTSDGSPGRAALNLYSAHPHPFDDQTRAITGLYGAQAALLLYGSDTATGLRRALDNRDMIGQAKGILMERFTVDDETAFQMLVKSSQDTNMKLTAVAHWLTSTVTDP